MAHIIVDESIFKENQKNCKKALKDVKRLKRRWNTMFNAMEKLYDEAMTNAKKYIYPYSPENYQYWMGKATAMHELKEVYYTTVEE